MNSGQRFAAELFNFGTRMVNEQFPIDPLRVAVACPPITQTDGPHACCAQFAAVVETDSDRSVWQCSVCRRMFHVPHQR